MREACPDCTQLWRVYGLATVRHQQVEEEQQDAARRGDTARVRALEAEVEGAVLAREKARADLYTHEAKEHGRTGHPASG